MVEEFTQSVGNTTKMGETLYDLIKNHNLATYASAELNAHATNAVGLETERGIRMIKKQNTRKIDLAIAPSMACVAAGTGPCL